MFLGTHVSVPVAATDNSAAQAERIQFSLAKGPCLNAENQNANLVADLSAQTVTEAWPMYGVP